MSITSVRTNHYNRSNQIEIEIYLLEEEEDFYTLTLKHQSLNDWMAMLSLKDPAGCTMQETLFRFREEDYECDSDASELILNKMIEIVNRFDPATMVIITGENKRKTYTKVNYATVLSLLKSTMVDFESSFDDEMERLEIFEEIRSLGHALQYDKSLEMIFHITGVISMMIEKQIQVKLKEKECPVLLEPLKTGETCMLPCKHLLSREAFRKINMCPGHPKCPVCRVACCPADVKDL